MPTIEILNGLLRDVVGKIEASDARLLSRRAEVERWQQGLATAQEKLEQLQKQDSELRSDHLQWMNYLNTLPDQGTPTMRQKLNEMSAEITRNVIAIRDHRQAVTQWLTSLQAAQTQ